MATPITIETTIAVPVEIVWQLWTDPEHITQWNNASPDWRTPSSENDVRPGGKFKATMAAKDGSVSFDFEGTYSEVVENQLIKYNIADGRAVTVIFEDLDEETKITETFEPESTNPVEMQRGGWQAILDNFKTYAVAQ